MHIPETQTVRFKDELERNITIRLGYANAKIYKCDNDACPRPDCYRSEPSNKIDTFPCERSGCTGNFQVIRCVHWAPLTRCAVGEMFIPSMTLFAIGIMFILVLFS